MLLNRFTRLKGIGRYACLGTAVLETLGRKYKMHNVQKGRIDYQLQAINNEAFIFKPEWVTPHLARDYIAPTIEQQANLCPDFTPELVFIDSFSELTDQMFRHKRSGTTFCCNYLDLQHSDEFAADFDNLGLMNLDGLQDAYLLMLRSIETRWPGIPVIYIHFPDALETREKFVIRSQHIRQVVEACAKSYSNLYSFCVPAEIVRPPEVVEAGLEDFPYHYNRQTYEAFAEMIRSHKNLRQFF